ncbi:MAG: Aliphatic amidase AmiE [Myxococcaceae bacterium]|nr:Aliphatic amidase AmiE [Myxococcaceae bacterium]
MTETKSKKRAPLTAAVIQLNTQDDVAKNLTRAGELVHEAVRHGAQVCVLPENFAFMGEEEDKRSIAESLEGQGPIVKFLRALGKEVGVHIVAGGMPEASGDPDRPFNTSVLVDPSGTIAARYRKVHLFDVDIGQSYCESRSTLASPTPDDVRVLDVRGAKLGMTVCYDVRFPELYRRLAERGAEIVTVPAAFTLMTGKDHWHVLLRARAVENQAFILAAGQWGKHPRGRQTYGHSLIVNPWGTVLAECGDGEGFATARLDFAYQDEIRSSLPALKHRRL